MLIVETQITICIQTCFLTGRLGTDIYYKFLISRKGMIKVQEYTNILLLPISENQNVSNYQRIKFYVEIQT